MFNHIGFARILKDKKMRARELSERTGIPQETISRLKRGKVSNPQLSTITTLARELEVSIDELAIIEGRAAE